MYTPKELIPAHLNARLLKPAFRNVTVTDAIESIKNELGFSKQNLNIPVPEECDIAAQTDTSVIEHSSVSGLNGITKNFNNALVLIDISAAAIRAEIEILAQIRTTAITAASANTSQQVRQNIGNNIIGLQKQLYSVVQNATVFGESLISRETGGLTFQTGFKQTDIFHIAPLPSDPETLGVGFGQLLAAHKKGAEETIEVINEAMIKLQQNLMDLDYRVAQLEQLFDAAVAHSNASSNDSRRYNLGLDTIDNIMDRLQKIKHRGQIRIYLQAVEQRLPAHIKTLLE